jgi:hypothetical protein
VVYWPGVQGRGEVVKCGKILAAVITGVQAPTKQALCGGACLGKPQGLNKNMVGARHGRNYLGCY